MNLAYFLPKMRGNVKKTTQPTLDLSPKHQTFIWEHHIWCHVKISEVATQVPLIPNFWCSLVVAAAELHLSFVIKGNVWWKRTFFRWLLSLCYIINIWSDSSHLYHMHCVVRQKRFQSVDL